MNSTWEQLPASEVNDGFPPEHRNFHFRAVFRAQRQPMSLEEIHKLKTKQLQELVDHVTYEFDTISNRMFAGKIIPMAFHKAHFSHETKEWRSESFKTIFHTLSKSCIHL